MQRGERTRRAPTLTPKKESPLDEQPIREITESLGGIAQRIHAAGADKKGPPYEALRITISHENATGTPTIRPRSHAMVSEGAVDR